MFFLKSRWVVPVSSPPIENGAVGVVGNRIVFVGVQSNLPHSPSLLRRGPGGGLDLGNAVLFPGLVNAHCHLEFSHLKGKTKSGQPFTEWVREMTRVGASGRDAPTAGIRRLLETGTTTVADHCSPDTPAFETPFRRIPLWEVLGAQKERAEASLEKALERQSKEGGFVTPHSLYAVHQDALNKLSLQSIHFLESADEDEFFRKGSGPLADYVRERGGEISNREWFQKIPKNGMLVHANYLNPSEIEALRAQDAAVIHCPGSHRFFGHRRFPLEDFKRTGLRVALGTDSLASNEDLSMLREMRLFHEAYPDVSKDEILKMATCEGAKALNLEREIGSIEVGKKADLVAVRGKDILGAERVIFSMIDGKVVLSDV